MQDFKVIWHEIEDMTSLSGKPAKVHRMGTESFLDESAAREFIADAIKEDYADAHLGNRSFTVKRQDDLDDIMGLVAATETCGVVCYYSIVPGGQNDGSQATVTQP